MAAGQGVPRGMIAQHHAVAMECADRLIEVDLDKAALAGGDRPAAQHRGAADDILGAEMQMHRQSVAQRRFGIARGAQKEVEPAHRQMPLGRQKPVAAAGLAAAGNEPTMLTAQRSPAAAVAIARFCACRPRTRTGCCAG